MVCAQRTMRAGVPALSTADTHPRRETGIGAITSGALALEASLDGEVRQPIASHRRSDEVPNTDTSQCHLRAGLQVRAQITSSIWHV